MRSNSMSAGNVLIIDDEEKLRSLIARILTLEGYTIWQAGDLKGARRVLQKEAVDAILCDVKLPDGNGVDFVKEVKGAYLLPEIILLTAYGNIPDGVQAIKNGAFDYITKGNDNDRILPLLSQAIEKVTAQRRQAVSISKKAAAGFSVVIGKSVAIRQTVALAKRIAPTNTTVLLLGETGTGKEVFAKAIHAESRRSTQPFIALNCSAFTRELLESELFGHRAGAFTGAQKDKKGLLEVANGGTLFLDEIGEMNPDLQAKLLRVLESGEFIKVGDTKTTRVDVRILAATNRDLQKEVQEGHFREDLLYRLNTFTIFLPALRERKEDIPELAQHFLDSFALRENRPVQKLSTETIRALENYPWKGNIRELRNVLERAVILSEGDTIRLEDLPSDIQQPFTSTNAFSLADVEKRHIQKILHYTGNNKTKTAQLLGIGLATLYRKMEEYNLSK